MKTLYTKFPLVLLTLLNYTPYAHAEKSNPDAITHTNETEANTETRVNTFINAEIPEDFDLFFNDHFSAKIVNEKNEKDIYSLLSQLPLSPAMQNSESSFTAEEFAKQLPAMLELKENSIIEITCADQQYAGTFPLGHLTAFGCSKIFRASINPESNILFLHFENEQVPNLSWIGIINTKTLVSMLIACAPEDAVKEIGLNSDCSQLGVMNKDDAILSYALPADLVNFAPSLKQRAFISYVDAQLHMLGQKIAQSNTNDVIKAYSQLPLEQVHKLALLIHTNKNMLPESLYDAVYTEKMNSLQQILTVSINAKFVADSLNIDIDTLVNKIASHEITQEQIFAILSPEEESADNDQIINA